MGNRDTALGSGATRRISSTRQAALQWWWLIWAGAGACVLLCGLVLGAATGGAIPGGGPGFLNILSPAFGGRDRVTILAIGVDQSEGRGLADTIILAAVWPKSGEMAALSVPRDSWVTVPGLGNRRVNAAHSSGGLPLTVQTVELLLGVPVDYYVEVSVPGLVDLVDAMGGVEIDVEKRMRYRDRAQGLNIDLHPGLQHLDGDQAVGYVRFRHDATGDLGRIERQRKFLRAVVRGMLSPDKVARLSKLAQTFVDTVSTNLTVRDILSLKKIVEQLGPEGIRMATLPTHPRTINGQSVLALDATEVQQTVDRVLWGQGIRVAILNGTEVNGLAARVGVVLSENGYDVIGVGNAERLSDTTLVLDHRGHTRRAERVSAVLGGGVVSPAPDGDNPADVTVILGRDMEGAAR